jgi:transcriptional regulator with XRE-family HTH domain
LILTPLSEYISAQNLPFSAKDAFPSMITAQQLRAARALLGIDQRQLAELCGLSVPTIQRMEASDGVIRGNVDSLMKLVGALDAAGIELIGEGVVSPGGGRGLRLKG